MSPSLFSHRHFLAKLTPPSNIEGLRHFNPALAEWKGRRVICWRVESAAGISRLAIGILNADTFAIEEAQMLDITAAADAQLADPRLCVAGKGLWLNYTLNADSLPPRMCFTELNFRADRKTQWKVGEITQPPAFKNGFDTAKNWIPFANGGLTPHFFNGPSFGGAWNMTASVLMESAAIKHPLGTVSGRTQALHILPENEFLAIIGGWREHPRRGKQYWFAAMTWDAATLAPKRFSMWPLVWAEENDEFIPSPRDPNYNPMCVFPCGLMLDSHKEASPRYLISLGINDSFMGIMHYSLEEMLLIPLAELGGARPLSSADATAMPADRVKVRVVCKHPIGEDGFTYHPGEEFEVPKDRHAALGAFVEVVE